MLGHYLDINVRHAALVELGGEVQAAVQRVVDGDVSAAFALNEISERIHDEVQSLDRECAVLSSRLRREFQMTTDDLFNDPTGRIERASQLEGAVLVLDDDGTLLALGLVVHRGRRGQLTVALAQ